MRRALLLLTALLLPLVPAPPASAAPAVCEPGPLQLAGSGSVETVAGRDHVQGYVLRRLLGGGEHCVVPGATVELLARTVGSQTSTVVRTGTTDADGRVQFRVRPPYSTVLTGRATAAGHPTTTSGPAQVTVSTRLTLARRTLGSCRVGVRGSTFPAKPGTPVEVFREVSPGRTAPPTRLTVRSDGTYDGVVAVPCGSRERLFAQIQATARNAFGSSQQVLRTATSTRTCGTATRTTGDAARLTHVFDAFNTTTVPGGSWWGERVLANRTDATLRFDVQSTDEHELLRRGSGAVLGANGFSDGISVNQVELAPGEELREVRQLVAANCFAPDRPGQLAAAPGPAFPSGTSIVGQTVAATDLGRSASQRVALTVE